jgi:5-methylthioadenosine/S-adenosylhomocysteine deaminase
MESVNQIIHCRWLIPCEDTHSILENHALIIKNGLIHDILPSKQATDHYSTSQTEHYTTHAVMPGLVNTHTHIAMNYFRGLADDLALMDWLNHHIWPAERAFVSHEFVYDASLLAMAEMLRSGTTCFNDMYFFLQATAQAADQVGIRAHIGMTVIDFPTAWAKNTDEYLTRGLEFFQAYQHHERITATLAPHAIYTVAEPTLLKVKEIAEKYDLKINMHIQETAHEIEQSLKQTGSRPLRRLQHIGLVSPRLIAVHLTQINDEDLEILAAGKPHIVHCPESNMKLASGICPLDAFKQRHLNIALGTDGAASNNDLNMLGEMRSAAFLAKLTSQNPEALPAAEALTMATLNGATALGKAHQFGSLTKGKAADFIAINLEEIETLPLYHPASQIVYAASRHQVTDVWVAGKQLLKNRQLTTLDEKELIKKAQYWAKKIKK